jgi:hypothetical protein
VFKKHAFGYLEAIDINEHFKHIIILYFRAIILKLPFTRETKSLNLLKVRQFENRLLGLCLLRVSCLLGVQDLLRIIKREVPHRL